MSREPITLTPELAKELQAGHLEQTCRVCGRWQAASWTCSWCGSPTGPVDWYVNSRKDERAMRMPRSRPDNPPSEYRSEDHWPKAWGPCPYVVRQRQTHLHATEMP